MMQQNIDNGLDARLNMAGTLRRSAIWFNISSSSAAARGVCAASQAMLRPDGAYLFIRGKFAAIRLRKGCLKRSFFPRRQLNHGLIFPGQLQKQTGELVLHLRRKTPHGLDGVFEQFGHGSHRRAKGGL
jgi:hypothetical protein